MHDHGLGVLEQYGLRAEAAKRGRGSLLCETDQGIKNIREYWGGTEKILREQKVQALCAAGGYPLVDLILDNQEGEAVSRDADGIPYVVRNWYRGRECDARSPEDAQKSAAALADLHTALGAPELGALLGEGRRAANLTEECRRHNREMKRVGKFLRARKKKNAFEELLSAHIGAFIRQGEETVRRMEEAGAEAVWAAGASCACHGECSQHNILFAPEGIAFVNFERWHPGVQIEDLAHFMRKILEKNRWNQALGRRLLTAYQSRRTLAAAELGALKLLLAYPWKGWKLVNCYAGKSKILISGKNPEKLNTCIAQWDAWLDFLGTAAGWPRNP